MTFKKSYHQKKRLSLLRLKNIINLKTSGNFLSVDFHDTADLWNTIATYFRNICIPSISNKKPSISIKIPSISSENLGFQSEILKYRFFTPSIRNIRYFERNTLSLENLEFRLKRQYQVDNHIQWLFFFYICVDFCFILFMCFIIFHLVFNSKYP